MWKARLVQAGVGLVNRTAKVEDGAVAAGGEIGHDWGEDAEGEGLGAAGYLIGMEGEGDFVELGK